MSGKNVERLKSRIIVVMVCYFITALTCVVSIYSKSNLLIVMYNYARDKVEEMAETAGDLLGYVLVFFILVLLGVMLVQIMKKGKPFSKSNIIKLRIIAGLTFCCGLLPAMLVAFIMVVCTDKTFFVLHEVHEICLMFLGSALFVISEIFYYGNELQDDVDLIA